MAALAVVAGAGDVERLPHEGLDAEPG